MKIEIEGDSPEAVAFALLRMVAEAEGKIEEGEIEDASRDWILDTYAECLNAANGMRAVGEEDEDEAAGPEDSEDDEDEDEDEAADQVSRPAAAE